LAVANDPRLAQAQALLKQGELTLAEVVGRQMLESQAHHTQALVLLGLIAARKGDLPASLQWFIQAQGSDPQQADLHFRVGLLQQQLGQDSEALQSLAAAIALAPQHAGALHAQGLSFKKLGRAQDALASYDSALAAAPGLADAWNNRAMALRQLGRLDEAVASLRKALALRPDSADIHNNLGSTLHRKGDFSAALEHYARALQLRPRDAQVLNNRGMALHALDRLEEAEAAYRSALQVDPAAWQTLMNLGVTQYEQKRHALALATLDRALALAPGEPDLLMNRANVLLELGRHDEALATYRGVERVRPDDAELRMNIGNALRETQRHADALVHYDKALAAEPGNADVRWNRSLCLLAMGDYAQGWGEYEWRKRAAKLGRVERDFAAPLWLGQEPLAGKTILLHAEQGLGDTLQMCRYAPLVAALGARVLLEVQKPVAGLLQALEGVSQLLARGDPLPPFDFHCPLMSLPLAMGTTLATVPAPIAYLKPEPQRVERWRNEVDMARLRVGLAWAGNTAFAGDHKRSLELSTLLQGLPDGPQYWSLQKDVAPHDRELLAGKIHCFEQNDFVNTAAQISLMDVVVSVETSIAQLAGALGCGVWVLLGYSADFRWLPGREDSPWLPTARVFRQPRPGDWASVMASLRQALVVKCGNNKGAS
jgi:tetratricopeptide (TPR) repeat protein